VTQPRVHASHEATLPHPAAAVWRYFHWPNLALMQPGGFFARIDYDEQRPVPGATRTLAGVTALVVTLAVVVALLVVLVAGLLRMGADREQPTQEQSLRCSGAHQEKQKNADKFNRN